MGVNDEGPMDNEEDGGKCKEKKRQKTNKIWVDRDK